MAATQFKGAIVPNVTPLTPDERVDTASLRRLVNYLIDGGVHGIWAAGTNGEFAALSDEQRLIAIETVVDEAAGRVPVIGNISAPGTQVAVDMGHAIRESGLDGVAATPPYYFNYAQDELIEHYRHIRERVGMPLWVYNIPSTVKIAVEPGTIAQLAGEGTVVGVKDSSGAGELLAQLGFLCDQGGIELWRFIGTVYRIPNTRGVGAHGVIPGIANLVPAAVAGAWEAGEADDAAKARDCMASLLTAGKVLRLAGGGGSNATSVSGLKSALKIMGVIEHDVVTRPLRPLTDEEKQPIPGILRELGLAA